ncbi:protein AF-9 [Leptidea sinapis]|uniref:protein AF-9 n=1 Tax=Leptidea sinapis TaxID=189913 RepID=UPI00213481D4|nr:protein AF-9 [Leptidea sinapis]
MSSIKVNFEIGHEASMRAKTTPKGFTHDWEVFVRGQEGAEISHFVDKVVFHLHETFPKPRRVVKEPPFTIKESGYAGFFLPIEIYLKNKDEPKKIKFSYDLTLQQCGCLKDRYIFQNPNDEFRRKLLKGGGIPVINNAFYTNPDQESRSRDSFTDEKQQLVSKPKHSSENTKKMKAKEYKEEIPLRTSSFETLFGAPIQKPSKVSPDPKKIEKSLPPVKSEKKDKERTSSEKKSKHEHKEAKQDKVKNKEEREKQKMEKVKNHNKDQEKNKDKPSKRLNERPPSTEPPKKRCSSPSRKIPSPISRSTSASSIKEEYKAPKYGMENFEQKKTKEERPPDMKPEKEAKEKKKKEKKSHDRDKERKEKKEHKKESHKTKEAPPEPPKEKSREVLREKETKESPVKDKPLKPEKALNKFSIENLKKTPPPDRDERMDTYKTKEKGDSEKKHKHKKKDKKRDESKEKHKESNKEKKHKHEKTRELVQETKPEAIEHRETPIAKPELASPISIDTASQCSSKSGLTKPILIETEDITSSHSESEASIINDDEEDDDVKMKIEHPSPETVVKREPSPEPEPEQEPEPNKPELIPESVQAAPPTQPKPKKHKDKSSKKEEKRRKRKAAEEENANRKVAKPADSGPSSQDIERGESSTSLTMETKVQDNGVSSSLGEDAEPGDLSPDYMVQLRGLQQRIMMIKSNEDLERVVNLIAETGKYEVTTQTFDFDLCLLDRSTVQQLIQLVGC